MPVCIKLFGVWCAAVGGVELNDDDGTLLLQTKVVQEHMRRSAGSTIMDVPEHAEVVDSVMLQGNEQTTEPTEAKKKAEREVKRADRAERKTARLAKAARKAARKALRKVARKAAKKAQAARKAARKKRKMLAAKAAKKAAKKAARKAASKVARMAAEKAAAARKVARNEKKKKMQASTAPPTTAPPTTAPPTTAPPMTAPPTTAPSTIAPCTSQLGKNAAHSKGGAASQWPSTTSSSQCQQKCADSSDCLVWTWHDQSFGDYAFKCVTFTSAKAVAAGRTGSSSWVSQGGVTSGKCSSPCTSQLGKNAAHSKGGPASQWPSTTSSSQCKQKCADSSDCLIWTWHDQSFGDYAFKCVTFTSAKAASAGRTDSSSWVPQGGVTSGKC